MYTITVLVKVNTHISCFMEKLPECKICNFREKKKIAWRNFLEKCWRKMRCKGKIYYFHGEIKFPVEMLVKFLHDFSKFCS